MLKVSFTQVTKGYHKTIFEKYVANEYHRSLERVYTKLLRALGKLVTSHSAAKNLVMIKFAI